MRPAILWLSAAMCLYEPVAYADDHAEAVNPSVPSLRAGTLGIPSTTGGGATAALNNRIESGNYTPQLLAKVGRLALTRHQFLEAIGETSTLDLPIALLRPTASQNRFILPALTPTGVTALGIRWMFVPGDGVTQDMNRCSTDLDSGVADDAEKATCERLGVTMSTAISADERLRRAAALHTNGFGFIAGFRFMFRDLTNKTSQDAKGSQDRSTQEGLALELGAQYVRGDVSGFVTGSFVKLQDGREVLDPGTTMDNTDDTVRRTLAVTELRLTVGGQYRVTSPGSKLFVPIGAYASYTRNWWQNDFATAGMDSKIRGYRYEAALYVTGAWSGGFGGLFSFAVARNYGDVGGVQYVISIAPAVGGGR